MAPPVETATYLFCSASAHGGVSRRALFGRARSTGRGGIGEGRSPRVSRSAVERESAVVARLKEVHDGGLNGIFAIPAQLVEARAVHVVLVVVLEHDTA